MGNRWEVGGGWGRVGERDKVGGSKERGREEWEGMKGQRGEEYSRVRKCKKVKGERYEGRDEGKRVGGKRR